MCVLFLAVNCHPKYARVIAANRDEYYARPSLPLHYWHDNDNILAGRDLQAAGGWLGVNRNARFCAVTNLRAQDSRANKRSRGELVSRYLRGGDDFNEFLLREYKNYNPFNCIFGNGDALHLFSSGANEIIALGDGFHAAGNAAPSEPQERIARGMRRFQALINRDQELTMDDLLALMQDATEPSPIFIHGETYGTRSTTILLQTKNQTQIREITHATPGDRAGRRAFCFQHDA